MFDSHTAALLAVLGPLVILLITVNESARRAKATKKALNELNSTILLRSIVKLNRKSIK